MKFMVAWKIPPGCYKAAVERFLNTGAPNGDLLELQITPVIEDAEAASSLAKVHGK